MRGSRYNGDARPDRTPGSRVEIGCRLRDEDAARQMREHLALVAVVIDRMGRASGDIGKIAMRMMGCPRARVIGGVLVRGRDIAGTVIVHGMRRPVMRRGGFEPDRWQDAERRKSESEERVPGDPRSDPTAARSARGPMLPEVFDGSGTHGRDLFEAH